ncbi:La domain family [Aspergillus lucknowensis]|uniref:HTH La-type RNA-binding domain-containing protein n=1 Tax=Aspergillus lucknowensis TaxID=176173 RepID=A0ABR4M695_9EURO
MAATFSYAQAAKGISPTQPSNTPPESTALVSKSDEQASVDSLQPNAGTAALKADTASDVDLAAVNGEKEVRVADTKADVSGTSSPATGTIQTSMLSKDDEASSIPSGNSESTWDKQSQVSGSDKQNGPAEGTKGKASGKEKPAPPKELKAAPLPIVNIWQQRKEAQEAKVKAAAALKPSAKPGLSKPPPETSSIPGENHDQSRPGNKKKGGDVSDRKKGDGLKGREDHAPVPPVADATLWPTPKVAQGEEKKKAHERSEKAEKSPVIRPHGKEKWTPVPYVPTAVFNTPLPSAARRGGRSTRGGRDTTRNGSHGPGSGSEKASSGQTAQGSTTKHTAAGERGRNEPNSARANSLPAPSRRSNSADNAPVDARKAPITDRTRGPKGTDGVNASTIKHINGEAFSRNAKPFPRNHEGAHKGGDYTSKNSPLSVDTHTALRPGPNPERHLESGPKSADFSSLHSDRKDREFSREVRSERGRGSHRGRGGGHVGYNGSQTSTFPNNHMAPQNFIHPKSFGFNDRRGQHALTNGSRGHAMTMRSPSLPNSNTMYNMYPFPTDINTMYGYQPVQPGPMSAVPYQPYVEQYSVVSMITMQLEYYFSVDNLCKDIYLRKHMDSQGFVGLNVIANFKRIKSLTEDFDMIRHVARQLKVAEHFVGEDGIDRLRPRDKWEQWVLPIDQREPSAQHAGPITSTSHNDTTASQIHVDGATNGLVPSSLTNGTIPSKTALSSAAPEFSPSNGLHSRTEISN